MTRICVDISLIPGNVTGATPFTVVCAHEKLTLPLHNSALEVDSWLSAGRCFCLVWERECSASIANHFIVGQPAIIRTVLRRRRQPMTLVFRGHSQYLPLVSAHRIPQLRLHVTRKSSNPSRKSAPNLAAQGRARVVWSNWRRQLVILSVQELGSVPPV